MNRPENNPFISEDGMISSWFENGRAKIKHHIISDSVPGPDAVPVKPSLEDAYLWLINTGKPGGSVFQTDE